MRTTSPYSSEKDMTVLYRTLREAQDSPRPFASWIERVIYRVRLADGREFYRTNEFDLTRHKCKRCRKAGVGSPGRVRLHATGHNCETCGNPYAGFVRQSVRHDWGQRSHVVLEHCWGSSGRLH